MDTHIPLPPDLVEKIERQASARGMSLGDFVRESLESALAAKPSADSLLDDDSVFVDDGPVDLASNHDGYLYGEAP